MRCVFEYSIHIVVWCNEKVGDSLINMVANNMCLSRPLYVEWCKCKKCRYRGDCKVRIEERKEEKTLLGVDWESLLLNKKSFKRLIAVVFDRRTFEHLGGEERAVFVTEPDVNQVCVFCKHQCTEEA